MTFDFEKKEKEEKTSVTLRYTLIFTKEIPREAYEGGLTDEQIREYEQEHSLETMSETIEWGLQDGKDLDAKVELV